MSRGAGPQGLRGEPCRSEKAPLSGEVARRNVETERLQQIYDDLSVSLRLTAPLRGEPRGAAHPAAFPYEGKVARRKP